MAKVFDIRLAPYAEQLTAIIGGHAALQEEYEHNRRIFNAHFRKVLQNQIRPVIDGILDEAARKGHWVEVHTLMDERYRVYLHQCYSIYPKGGVRGDIAIVANYDYKKIFFIVEIGGKTTQMDLQMHRVTKDAVADWLMANFPTL
jgi:hypothetical protein